MTDITTNSESESRSEPQPEDLASREDLLLAYDRLSREFAGTITARVCGGSETCTVLRRADGRVAHSDFPGSVALLREDA